MKLYLTDDKGTVIDSWDPDDDDDERDLLREFANLLGKGPTHDAIIEKLRALDSFR